MKVYVLQHTHVLSEDNEDVKFIGVYSSEETGRKAIEQLLKQPGFCDSPDGFDLDTYEIDQTNWIEGYSTYRY